MSNWHKDKLHKQAKRENFLARSVYKLEEIENREHILRNAKSVVDLGAAPGSWSQLALKLAPKAKIVAIDPQPLGFSDPRLTSLETDLESADLSTVVESGQVDVVLSDMAPKTTGIHDADVARSLDLAEAALDFASRNLRPGGALVVKLFMGAGFDEFSKRVGKRFTRVNRLRPESTRKHSREIYIIGKGFHTESSAAAPAGSPAS